MLSVGAMTSVSETSQKEPHLWNVKSTSKALRQVLIAFFWLREQPEVRKRASTSELIDWIAALRRAGIAPETMEERLPFLGVLLKREQDLESLTGRRSRSRYGTN